MSTPEGIDPVPLLEGLGIPDDEIERNRRNGTLGLLAVERLILRDLSYDIHDVEQATDLSAERIGNLWGALGFPEPRPSERIFNDTDIMLLSGVANLMDAGIADPDVVIQVTRIVGASMARIANLQSDLLAAGERSADFAPGTGLVWFGDVFGVVLEQVWRRHVQTAARARLSGSLDSDMPPLAVGFADLVGFTALSQQLDAVALAGVVDRFESVAYATVNEHGGRVVKMIGDEVMFAIEDPVAAARCALDLAESYHQADDLSDVRVGVAYGPAIDRDGDLFGPVVNLASRMTGIAYPGAVLVDDDLRAALDGYDEFDLRGMRPRRLKHLGLVRVHILRRADGGDTDDRRRRERRSRVAELAQDLLPGSDR